MEQLLRAAALAATFSSAIFAGIAAAAAQNFPTRPVTIVVPFAAGGPADAMARVIGDRMRASLGQTIIIENNGTAAGSIGVGRVAQADPEHGPAAAQMVERDELLGQHMRSSARHRRDAGAEPDALGPRCHRG